MEQPSPADGWPDGPLSEQESIDRMGDGGCAVWVMDHDSGVRSVSVPSDAPDDAVIDIVFEYDDRFEMYSYSRGRWMDYGTQRMDDEDAPPMSGTLESFRLLEGDSTVTFG